MRLLWYLLAGDELGQQSRELSRAPGRLRTGLRDDLDLPSIVRDRDPGLAERISGQQPEQPTPRESLGVQQRKALGPLPPRHGHGLPEAFIAPLGLSAPREEVRGERGRAHGVVDHGFFYHHPRRGPAPPSSCAR